MHRNLHFLNTVEVLKVFASKSLSHESVFPVKEYIDMISNDTSACRATPASSSGRTDYVHDNALYSLPSLYHVHVRPACSLISGLSSLCHQPHLVQTPSLWFQMNLPGGSNIVAVLAFYNNELFPVGPTLCRVHPFSVFAMCSVTSV